MIDISTIDWCCVLTLIVGGIGVGLLLARIIDVLIGSNDDE